MNPWGQKKWYARTCEVRDGSPTIEHWAPTLELLKSLVSIDRPNFWVIWKEGEYRETWSTIWDGKRTLYCIHRSGESLGVPFPPVTEEETKELEKAWKDDWEENARWKRSFDLDDFSQGVYQAPLPHQPHPVNCDCYLCETCENRGLHFHS